jgi:GNAT superfamily N-acetyltransferase
VHPTPDLAHLDAIDVRYAALNASRALRAEESALALHRAGTLTVLVDRARPHDDYYNRIVGLDAAGLVHLDHALARLSGVDPRVDLAVDRLSADVSSALIERGLAPKSAIVWLGARPPANLPMPEGVRLLRDGEQGVLFDLMAQVEEMRPSVTPEIRARRWKDHCTPQFRCFVRERGGRPVAWATLYADGEAGILGNAFTLPAHRGHGSQAALLTARLHDAAQLGLSWVYTDVEPGTSSLRNAERAGLRRATTTLVWARR